MATKKNIIELSSQERADLEKVARSTQRSVREKTRARILLLSDTALRREAGGSCSDGAIARRLRCSILTVASVRAKACARGAVATVWHQEQQHRKARKLNGRQEAQLVALTCSAPPAGRARWSLVLLRERLIALQVVEQIGLETIRTTLKKTRSSRG